MIVIILFIGIGKCLFDLIYTGDEPDGSEFDFTFTTTIKAIPTKEDIIKALYELNLKQ
jgi:hypothetical protein